MSYLLDTCILSQLRKLKLYPSKQLREWFCKHPEHHYFISVLSIGEIQKGISKLKDGEKEKKMILEDWLTGELLPRFEGRIVGIDAHTSLLWGQICGESQKRGILLPVIDSLLAASAIQHNLTLVTENTKDFSTAGCRLLNPCL